MAKSAKDFDKLRKKLLEGAKEKGLDQDYKFMTTLERYDTQIKNLKKLEEVIENSDTIVEKEYGLSKDGKIPWELLKKNTLKGVRTSMFTRRSRSTTILPTRRTERWTPF